MIDGSVRVLSSTLLPVTCASRCSIVSARPSGERRRRRDFGANHLAVVEQPIAVGRQQIRNQHEPIAVGEQRDQLAENRRRFHEREQIGDRGALARHRHGRVRAAPSPAPGGR